METTPIANLVFDQSIWPRLERSRVRITQLVDMLEAGATLPAVRIERSTMRVLGGWHTVAAYQARGLDAVPVEYVDVGTVPGAALLYAYRIDADAALPYTDADVKSVARRLYQDIAREVNGYAAVNVSAIARDLGRSRRTVDGWVQDLVEADTREQMRRRHGRVLVVQALRAAGLTQQAIAGLVGVSQPQVISDGKVAIAYNALDDPGIVLAAQGRLGELLLTGQISREVNQQALDWLLEQTNPAALRQQRRARELARVSDILASVTKGLKELSLDIVEEADPTDDDEQIGDTIDAIHAVVARLYAWNRRRVCSDPSAVTSNNR